MNEKDFPFTEQDVQEILKMTHGEDITEQDVQETLDMMQKIGGALKDMKMFEVLDELPPDVQGEAWDMAAERILSMFEEIDPAEGAQEAHPLTDEGLEALQRQTQETQEAAAQALTEALKVIDLAKGEEGAEAKEAIDALKAANSSLQDANNRQREALQAAGVFPADAMEILKASIADFSEWYDGLLKKEVSELTADELLFLGVFSAADNVEELLPIIQEETEAYKSATNREQVDVEEFFRDTDPDTGKPIESIYDKVLRRIQEQAGTAEAVKELISLGGHRPKEVLYPIDKVNNSIWNLLEENTHGQLEFDIKANPNKSRREVNIIYSINFDAIESESPILKRLTGYDKRVFLAFCALWHAGNPIFTLSQLYQTMGHRGEPGKRDRNKMNQALTKMRATISLDNWQEIDAGYKYPRYKYDGPLLPFERLTIEQSEILINGRLANEYIRPFREPALLTFAIERNQVTTIDPKLLQTPLSKTEQNLAIEDYCIERIRQCKRGGNKILLSTLYKQCNITTRKQKERTPAKIEKLFDYYKQCGEIEDYDLTEEAITFKPSKPTPPIK